MTNIDTIHHKRDVAELRKQVAGYKLDVKLLNDEIAALRRKDVANLIYKHRLSIECIGTWFMTYRGERPTNKVRTGFFTWEYVLNTEEALSYELSVTDAVHKAVDKLERGEA